MPHTAIRRRVLFTVLVLLLCAATLSFSSASSLGGLKTNDLGGTSADTQTVSGIMLDWNVGIEGSDLLRASTVRLTTDSGEQFHAGDAVEATIVDGDGAECESSNAATTDTTELNLSFGSCELLLVDLDHIALSITGAEQATTIRGNLGGVTGTLSSFDGNIVGSSDQMTAGIKSRPLNGVETISSLFLEVYDATVEQLVGVRYFAALHGEQGDNTYTSTYTGTIGTADDNTGIWAEVDPSEDGVDAYPTVTADIWELAAGDPVPAASEITSYDVVLLYPQHLGASNSAILTSRDYSLEALTGTVDSGGSAQPVTDGTQPVGLDSRLTYSEPNGRANQNSSLSFCYSFRVTNTDSDPFEWSVTFDTTKPPLWGLDPTTVSSSSSGTLNSLWGAVTDSYDPETGYWTLKGVDYNRILRPGESADVGYCARANIPPVDPSTFDTQIAVTPVSGTYNAELAVSVTSTSEYFVPWEAEVDLADYFCEGVLPSKITSADSNTVLTQISGTKYLLQGTVSTNSRFVSSRAALNLVFLRFNPQGHEFRAGSCS